MAKRTSFDQKVKGTHKTRQKIIDTVFGREDNNQHVFGYEGEVVKRHEVGERWTDKDGKEWEQKEGYIASVSKFDEIRNYLKEITTCSSKDCKTITYNRPDKKLIARTGMCFDCLQKLEAELRADGSYPFYEDYKITLNKLATVRELKSQYEQALKDISTQLQMVNEDGTMSNWKWDIDIDKVKADIEADIEGAVVAIALLLERQSALEIKLIELNRDELIK